MTNFTLYGTSACHLCELAEAQLEQLSREGRDLAYRKVDIAADDSLMVRYGVLIPVLRRDHDGAELNWPFQPDDVVAMF